MTLTPRHLYLLTRVVAAVRSA